jgi:xylulokinase
MSVTLTASAALSWIAQLTGCGVDIDSALQSAERFAQDRNRRFNAPTFLPYLNGERTPHNDSDARGLFADLRADHGAEALIYAVLEGVAFALADGLEILEQAGATPASFTSVGGGSRSIFWLQMIADVLSIPLEVAVDGAAGASIGAARLAMLAVGAGTEADVCRKAAASMRLTAEDNNRSMFERRRARFKALYRGERSSRSAAC